MKEKCAIQIIYNSKREKLASHDYIITARDVIAIAQNIRVKALEEDSIFRRNCRRFLVKQGLLKAMISQRRLPFVGGCEILREL
jgi:hypothetical protein